MPSVQMEGDTRPSEILFVYGLTIMMVGALAFNAANMSSKAISAIFASNGFAAAIFVCAAAVRRHGAVKKGDSGYVPYMLGIHLGLVLPMIYATASGARLVKAWPVPEKAYLLPYLSVNIVASFVASTVLMRFKPEKSKKAAGKSVSPKVGFLQQRVGVAQRNPEGPKSE